MTIQKVKNSMYDLQTFVGDSGMITIGNIPKDLPNYTLYMEIHGKTTVTKSVALQGADETSIQITAGDTEALGAGSWPYGVKLCSGSQEDTYIPDMRIAPNAYFIVKPKIVEGV